MRSSHTLDRVDTAFDDDHLVADAMLGAVTATAIATAMYKPFISWI